MSKEPTRQTAYSDYIYNQIDEYFRSGGVGFTAPEFAKFARLKVTGNLRRRLNHAVAAGRIGVSYSQRGKRSRFLYYYEKPQPEHMGEIPF